MTRRLLAVLAMIGLVLPVVPALAQEDEGLLPKYRIISYYGYPGNPNMGILGEYDLDPLRRRLDAQTAAYQKADPDRPVKQAFEVIASVAQPVAGDDGTFLVRADDATIQPYLDYTDDHDMLLFVDVQIGRAGVASEIEAVRPWLKHPNVHLALDPEFAMDEGQIPGQDLGHIDATDVTEAQQTLAKLSADEDIPPKVLIVHQFRTTMITNKEGIRPVPGVQLVIDADGFGTPDEKREAYDVVITQEPVEFNGIKLFYRQDEPVMRAVDVVALDPVPDLVIYQ